MDSFVSLVTLCWLLYLINADTLCWGWDGRKDLEESVYNPSPTSGKNAYPFPEFVCGSTAQAWTTFEVMCNDDFSLAFNAALNNQVNSLYPTDAYTITYFKGVLTFFKTKVGSIN